MSPSDPFPPIFRHWTWIILEILAMIIITIQLKLRSTFHTKVGIFLFWLLFVRIFNPQLHLLNNVLVFFSIIRSFASMDYGPACQACSRESSPSCTENNTFQILAPSGIGLLPSSWCWSRSLGFPLINILFRNFRIRLYQTIGCILVKTPNVPTCITPFCIT